MKNLTDLVEKSFNEYSNDSDQVINSTMHVYYDAKSPYTFCDVAESYNNRPLGATTTTTTTTTKQPSSSNNNPLTPLTSSNLSINNPPTFTSSFVATTTQSSGRKQRHLKLDLEEYFDDDDEEEEIEFTLSSPLSQEEEDEDENEIVKMPMTSHAKSQYRESNSSLKRNRVVRDVKTSPSTQAVSLDEINSQIKFEI